MVDLDSYDRAILEVLQQEGKISAQDLAQKTHLSASPSWRRVRRLEKKGVIERYAAILNPAKLGLTLIAYIHVSLTDHSEDSIECFDRFVQEQERIVECASVTGEDDFLLKVLSRDTAHLEDFIMHQVLRLGIVRSSKTFISLRQTKYTTKLPLDL